MWLFLFLLSPVFAQNSLNQAVEQINKAVKIQVEKDLNCTEESCRNEDKYDCAEQFDLFCSELYSSKNKGSIKIPLSEGGTIDLQMASKNNRNQSPAFEAYNLAKIKYRDSLPKDLKSELDKKNYFDLLKNYTLMTKKKSLRGQTEDLKKWQEVRDIWINAVDAVSIDRLDKQISGAGEKEKLDLNERKTYNKIFNKLNAEIYEGIWKNSPEWKKINVVYSEIKKEFIDYIKANSNLSSFARKKMLERLNNLTLIIPGTDEDNPDEGCAQTERNAYYRTTKNQLTVCAGLFSAPSYTIIAHEMAHAIDPHSLMIEDYNDSILGIRLAKYLEGSCGGTGPDCNEWNKLKEALPKFNIKKNQYYSESYLQCLRNKELLSWPEESVLDMVAKSDVNSFIDRMASGNYLLNLAAPEIRNKDGEKEKNRYYMNVCELFDIRNSNYTLSSAMVMALTYVSEYHCAKNDNDSERLINATNKAKEFGLGFENKTLNLENNLTENVEMIRRKYSAPIGEKAADNIGLRVAAKLIEKKYKNLDDKKNIVFSSSVVFCDGFTLASDYPELAVAQKSFSSEPHSQDYKRRREIMTKEIRDILACRKPPETVDCSL